MMRRPATSSLRDDRQILDNLGILAFVYQFTLWTVSSDAIDFS